MRPQTPAALALALLLPPLLACLAAPAAGAQSTLELGPGVTMRAAAVGETAEGELVGSTATITITAARNGTGHVFLDTFPLTNIDMQGSARLAARVAAHTTGERLDRIDLFFVIRSGSEQIGGPSAGAALAVGAIAAMEGWRVRDDVLITGTINADGTVGPVGGIPEKAAAAARAGLTRFLFPAGQELSTSGSGRVVNMTSYCDEQLRIECLPVTDVVEAVNLMTDHVIERAPVTGNVTGDEYLATLASRSQALVDDAAALVEEAAAAVGALAPGDARTALAQRLDGANATLQRAQEARDAEQHYTAASLSFQASIEAHYVRDAARVLAAGADASAQAEAALAATDDVVTAARVRLDAADLSGTGRFETAAAAQTRLLEAEERLAAARETLRNATTPTQLLEAVYQSAYAAQRAGTATWWLDLGGDAPAGDGIEPRQLEALARDILTTSREEVAYAEAVFSQAGIAVTLGQERALLETAETAMARGYHAAAMLDALEAGVRAGVKLETAVFGGELPEVKFATARESAARAIQAARDRGVESYLAQSAYEFALSLPDGQDKLVYFGLARVTANLAGLPGLAEMGLPPAQTRFQGIAATSVMLPATFLAGAFAVGLALGVGLGLVVLLPRRDEPGDAPLGEPAAPVGAPAPAAPGLTREEVWAPESQAPAPGSAAVEEAGLGDEEKRG